MLLIFWQIAGVDFFVERAAGRKTKGLVFVACRHSGTNRWKVYIFSRHLGQCIETTRESSWERLTWYFLVLPQFQESHNLEARGGPHPFQILADLLNLSQPEWIGYAPAFTLGQMHRFSRFVHQGHWQVAHKPSFMCHLSVSPEPELEKLCICPKVILSTY